MPAPTLIEAMSRLELADGSMGEKVFGNAMFEDDSVTSPSTPDKCRHSIFDETKVASSQDARTPETPDQSPCVTRRGKDG